MDEEREKAVKCLRKLRNLLTDDEDLKVPIHDEKFLIRFVRGKKYDADRAYETVRKYFTLKKKNPKVFKMAYPSHELVKELILSNAVMKLKENDPEGRAILAWNTDKWDTEKYTLDHMLAAIVLVVEEMLFSSVEIQIKGIVVIINDDTLNLSHLKQMSPGRANSLLQIAQGTYPIRIKEAHIVKEPAIIDLFMLIMKPFLTTKLKKRLVFHGHDLEKFHEKLPIQILPLDYGGILTDEEAYDEDLKKNLFARDGYYQELLQYGFGQLDSDEEDTYM